MIFPRISPCKYYPIYLHVMKPLSSTPKLRHGSILLLSACFVAAYCGMRSLPVEPCNFLHSQDTLGDEDSLEYCGPDESSFIDLDKVRFPLRVQVRPLQSPKVGEACTFRMTLHNYKEEALVAADIAVSHTEKVHLLCVDESLSDYQHVHPWEVKPGVFEFSLTPMSGGIYKCFLDFIVLRSGSRVLLQDSFTVEGASGGFVLNGAEPVQVGDYAFTLKMGSNIVSARQTQTLELKVLDASVNMPVTLEPVMGAFAHLVAFDTERRGFAHFHPLAQGEDLWNAKGQGLQFSFQLRDPGTYRLWAQVKIDGRELFAPFDLNVI